MSLLLLLLQHAGPAVRQAVGSNLQSILSNSDISVVLSNQILSKLVDNVEQWAQQREDICRDAVRDFKTASAASDEAVTGTVSNVDRLNIPSSNVLSSALSFSIPQINTATAATAAVGGDINAIIVTNALILASHPLLSNSKTRSSTLWNQIQSKLMSNVNDSQLEPIFPAGVIPVLGPRLVKLMQGGATSTKCALNVVELLCSQFGESGYHVVSNILLPFILETLSGEALTSISNSDIQTYQNPEAAIAKLVSSAEVSVADIKITNADRKKDSSRGSRRGQFESDLLLDEDWAERVRKEKADKLNQAKAGGFGDLNEKARKDVRLIA